MIYYILDGTCTGSSIYLSEKKDLVLGWWSCNKKVKWRSGKILTSWLWRSTSSISTIIRSTDFNTLGLYRSIIENEKLTLDEKIEVREYAHKFFQKTFDFLQLKDPDTFVRVSTIGQSLTVADERQIWTDIIANQEKILKDKRIKHRSFGQYSKHSCGYDNCQFNGVMIKKGSLLAERSMFFHGDKSKYQAKVKSERRKKERKSEQHIVHKSMSEE